VPHLIPLAPSEIHLWLSFYEEIDVDLHAAYRKLLDSSEREQEPRFYFETDRRRYLVTRALLRTVLSRYAPLEPTQWMFSTNGYGKPEIANAQGRKQKLAFNLSHTRSLIALGITRGRALGVDVENFRRRKAAIDVADHFFAPQEVAALSAEPAEKQQYRFFEYWTFKEAYIKARGMGLALPLDKFSFHYSDDHSVEINIDPDLGDNAARWQFWQFRPSPEYLAAVCGERVGMPCSVVVRRTVPMQDDNEFAADFLRISS
jgi:4'-phosphopantetheinyl transferase